MRNILIASIIAFLIIPSSCISQNEKDENLINIPGTRVYLEIPDSFKVKDIMPAIEKNESTGIMITDLPNGDYYANIRNFTKDNWERQGIVVSDFFDHEFEGYNALSAKMYDGETETQFLIFGDSTFSVMIVGFASKQDEISIKQIQNCIKTIKFKRDLKIDFLELAFFDLDIKASRYNFISCSSNSYLYQTTKEEENHINFPNFVISQLPFEKKSMTPKLLGLNLIFKLVSKGVEFEDVEYEKTFIINGYNAYETYFIGQLENQEVSYYILVLTHENRAIILTGTTNKNFEFCLNEFIQLGHSMKFK